MVDVTVEAQFTCKNMRGFDGIAHAETKYPWQIKAVWFERDVVPLCSCELHTAKPAAGNPPPPPLCLHSFESVGSLSKPASFGEHWLGKNICAHLGVYTCSERLFSTRWGFWKKERMGGGKEVHHGQGLVIISPPPVLAGWGSSCLPGIDVFICWPGSDRVTLLWHH